MTAAFAEPVTDRGFAAELLARLAQDRDRIILMRRGRAVLAGELLDRAGLAAGQLAVACDALGPHPRIGLMLHDNLETLGFAVGCWLIGAEVHYLDYRVPMAAVAELARRDGCAMVVTRRHPPSQAGFLVTSGIDPEQTAPEILVAARLRVSAALARPVPALAPAEVLSSSGVSGPPRLYPVTQGGMLKGMVAFGRNGRRGEWGSALLAMNLAFGGARAVCWRNLLAGRLLVLLDLVFSTPELDRALADPLIEECTLPPVLIRALVRHHLAEGAADGQPRYPHLKKLQSIGGPASAREKLEAWQHLSRRFVITYSSTETGVVSRLEGEDLLHAPDSCGKPLAGRCVEILGPDGTPLPRGQTGLIRVTLPTPANGHRHVFPGDLGWLDDEGFLHVSGRGDGIICRKGESFSAATIEETILNDQDLRDAAVLALPGATGDDGILFALHPVAGADRDALVARILARLPALRRPDAIMFAEPGDITAGGKIRRAAMLARHLAQPGG